jgi:nucleoside-triphosphatase
VSRRLPVSAPVVGNTPNGTVRPEGARPRNGRLRLFLTGPPRCGKTTLLIKLARAAGAHAQGFYTEEVREEGRRVGFRIRTLATNEAALLSHVALRSGPRVGSYVVSLENIERLIVPAMRCQRVGGLVMLDEIGKMECLSAVFRAALLELLDSPCHVVATIAKRGGAFIDSLKGRPGVRLVEVSPAARDRLAAELAEEIRGLSSGGA